MRRAHWTRIAAASLSIALIGAAGCSRDSSEDTAEGSTTTVAAGVPKSKDFKLDAPVKIVATQDKADYSGVIFRKGNPDLKAENQWVPVNPPQRKVKEKAPA